MAIGVLCQVVSIDNKGLIIMHGNSPYISLDTPGKLPYTNFRSWRIQLCHG